MEVYNVKRIFDNGEFITIETPCGNIHLPAKSYPSINIKPDETNVIAVQISLYVD